MSLTSVDKAAFARLAQSQQAGFSSVAALCFLAWDICITTDAEVTYMWLTPWSWTKLLYFVTRYYSLIALCIVNRHHMTCLEWLVFEGFSALALEIVVDLILILRLYAMYTGNKKVLNSMIAVFVLCIIIMATSLGISIPKIMISPQCVEAVLPSYMIVYTIASIACEGFLFTLAMLKFRDTKRGGWGNRSLLTVLMRDSAGAFGILFVAMIANMVLFTLGPRTLAAMGFPWLLALLGTIGPRLFLNVRAANREHLTPSALSQVDMSRDLYFAVNPDDLDLVGEAEGDDEFDDYHRNSMTPLTSQARSEV